MSEIQYKKDDLVWAKIKGCSWWPAVVSSVEKGRTEAETQITVNFVGDNSHAILPPDKILGYEAGHEQYSVVKKRGLADAIKYADEIHKKLATYEGQ